MGDYIEEHGGANISVLEGLADHIRQMLIAGSVVLGERHDKPAARAVVADLMIAKAVQTLFVELNDMTQFPEDEFVWVLRNVLDPRFNNPIPFEALLTIAAFNRVQVVGYDNPTSYEGRTSPTSASGMKNRNHVMGHSVRTHGGPRSIALVGSFHLMEKHSGGRKSSTLHAKAGIPATQAIDLSGY